jgi:hypothetical protein
VSDFFHDFKYIHQSVVLGVNFEGKKNGFGAILFETEDEAASAAKDMNRQYIGNGSRYVDLSVISYEDYLNFNSNYTKGGEKQNSYGGNGSYVKLYECVNTENLN